MGIQIAHRVIFGLLLQSASTIAAEPPKPPETRIEVVTDRMHGSDVPDPYRWLEDQENSRTRAWISAQNAYTRTILGRCSRP